MESPTHESSVADADPDYADRDDVELDDVDRIVAQWQRERPDLPADSIGVITRVWRVSKLLAEDRRRTTSRLGIDPALRDVLSMLRRAGEPYALPAGELARRAGVSPGAMSQRAERAERGGWVHRTRDPVDGRRRLVTLTDAGRSLVDGTVADLLRHEDDLLSSLDGAQRAQLADLLRILLADLRSRSGGSDAAELDL